MWMWFHKCWNMEWIILYSLVYIIQVCDSDAVMECFIHNMPANEMTLIMEQEE